MEIRNLESSNSQDFQSFFSQKSAKPKSAIVKTSGGHSFNKKIKKDWNLSTGCFQSREKLPGMLGPFKKISDKTLDADVDAFPKPLTPGAASFVALFPLVPSANQVIINNYFGKIIRNKSK